jgi:hypothetical protein
MRDLPRLLRLWPHQLSVLSIDDHARIIERLRSALRRERQMGLARRWSYDLGRHAALLRALKAESGCYSARLEQAQSGALRAQGSPRREDEVVQSAAGRTPCVMPSALGTAAPDQRPRRR